MKKIYIGFAALLILGVGAGIFYLEVIRAGNAELPEDIVMENAFEGDYAFADMPDKARLVEFMYTNCPDVCPVTTVKMSELRQQLIKDGVFGEDIEFLTITIDPSHDTAEVLQEYAGRFEVTTADDGWKFLRASADDTQEVADSLNFRYRDPGTGDIIHETFTYFIDENNTLLEKFAMGEGFDTDKVYRRIMNTIK